MSVHLDRGTLDPIEAAQQALLGHLYTLQPGSVVWKAFDDFLDEQQLQVCIVVDDAGRENNKKELATLEQEVAQAINLNTQYKDSRAALIQFWDPLKEAYIAKITPTVPQGVNTSVIEALAVHECIVIAMEYWYNIIKPPKTIH